MSDAAKKSQFEFSVSELFESWKCEPCEYEFAIFQVMRCVGEYGETYDQVFNWGNPDRPPFCPRCGSKEKVSR